jgi:hypothetical protein
VSSTSTAQAEYEYDNAVIPDFGQHLVVVIGEKCRFLKQLLLGVGVNLWLASRHH